MITVSVLIPAYNEEATILQILEKVNAVRCKDVKFEILVVDDGSKDKTIELLEQQPGSYSQLIKMPKNGGKGAAVKAGLKAATGDYILFQDADLEYDPQDFPKMVYPALQFKADVIMGSRFLAPECVRVCYFWHKVGNFFITFLFNILNNTTFTDVYTCYLMFRRDLVDADRLVTQGWEQQAEILSVAVRKGKVFYEVPVNYHGRSYKEGKKIRAHHTIAVIWTMLKMRVLGLFLK